MPHLIQNLLLLCLIPMAAAGITNFWDRTPITPETMACLRNSGYLEEAFVLADFGSGGQEWQVALDLNELANTGSKVNLMLSTAKIQGRLTPQLEALRIAKQFQSFKIHKFWIGVSNFQGSFRPSCGYLRTVALYLRLYTQREIGFQSELLFWEDLFGQGDSCVELGRYSLFLSFNKFKPFGGWRDYEFYETYKLVPVCDYPGMEVFRK